MGPYSFTKLRNPRGSYLLIFGLRDSLRESPLRDTDIAFKGRKSGGGPDGKLAVPGCHLPEKCSRESLRKKKKKEAELRSGIIAATTRNTIQKKADYVSCD